MIPAFFSTSPNSYNNCGGVLILLLLCYDCRLPWRTQPCNREASRKSLMKGKKPFIPCCCPGTGLTFYLRTLRALYHFIITRTGVHYGRCHYADDHEVCDANEECAYCRTSCLYSFSSRFFGLLANAFMSLVFFFEMIYEYTRNLYGIPKIWLLKFTRRSHRYPGSDRTILVRRSCIQG